MYLSVAISKISTRENTLVDDDGLFFVINATTFHLENARTCVVCAWNACGTRRCCVLVLKSFARGCEMTKEEGKNNTGGFMFRV